MVFTGRAIHDDGVFAGVAEDVSDLISMISPFETPLMDRLAQAPRPAKSVLHGWMVDQLNPNTAATSVTLDTASTGPLTIHDGAGADVARFLQVGAVLQVSDTGEYLQITAISGDNLTVARAFGGTTADTISAGVSELFIISDAALEGADVTGDISRPRTQVTNYTQIFKKDIIVSGTVQNVTHLGGVSDEMDYQRTQRMKEALRDLEKAVIRGKTSGNTIGSATQYRTFRGILDFLQTNSTNINSTVVGSLTPDSLNEVISGAWERGATDLDLIVADSNFKRIIDSFNTTRVDVTNRDERFHNRVSFFEGTYGTQEVILDRWMPANSLMVISTQRIHVVPLQGRSFTFQPVARTGDAEKAMILGEYTIEVHNEEGMAQAFA